MGFAIIADKSHDYGFVLRGDGQPTNELYSLVDTKLCRDLSRAELQRLDGQHIGFVTDSGLVDLCTQYRRASPSHNV